MKRRGELIHLEEYTREKCHDFYRKYIADPQMTELPFAYDKQNVDHYYDSKVLDKQRVFFAIMLTGSVIGEIQLKRINFSAGEATLSIILSDDAVKNRGYGTEAVKLIIAYGADTLNLRTIYADAVSGNNRSRHVLEKMGFVHLENRNSMSFYKLELSKTQREEIL